VHRRELVRQASAKVAWAGVDHGVVAAGLDRDHDAPVLVLSVQTAVRRLDCLPKFDFVVADEAHHCRAETWRRLLAAWPEAKILGVTATPARLDGKGLGRHVGGIFDELLTGATVAELQTEGWLAETRCFAPPQPIDTTGLRTNMGDWSAPELAERASVITGDAVAEYRRHANHQPAIAYACTVEHAEDIAEAFRQAGYRAACVHGDLRPSIRDARIAGLTSGEIEILTSCDLISEGLDVPAVGAVLLLRPTQSLVLAMQQIGRGMRPKPSGRALVVLDHAGNVLRHGLPETPREWSLDGQPRKSRGSASASGSLRRCEACGCVNPREAIECCVCGEEFLPTRRPPEVVDGRLAQITAEEIARVTSMSYRSFTAQPRSRRELEIYALHHGYRPGWVWYRVREQAEAAS
jgi:superfamily II DNA or RNA helicase